MGKAKFISFRLTPYPYAFLSSKIALLVIKGTDFLFRDEFHEELKRSTTIFWLWEYHCILRGYHIHLEKSAAKNKGKKRRKKA